MDIPSARYLFLAGWLLLPVACQGEKTVVAPSPASETTEESQLRPADSSSEGHSPTESQEFTIDERLSRALEERGLEGSIAVYDVESRRLLCSHEGACDKPYQPASTFKIPHTLIGLELGELESSEHEFEWDGEEYSVAAWNQNHTLRSAMEVSCVPCFQQLARRIGEERMREALQKLDYGNTMIGSAIDVFWLEPGALRISQRQQLTFLQRLKNKSFPFSHQAMASAIDVIPKQVGSDYVLRGKTGLLGGEQLTGWYVGFLEWPGGVTYFATVLTRPQDAEALAPARREVSVAALRLVTGMSQLE